LKAFVAGLSSGILRTWPSHLYCVDNLLVESVILSAIQGCLGLLSLFHTGVEVEVDVDLNFASTSTSRQCAKTLELLIDADKTTADC